MQEKMKSIFLDHDSLAGMSEFGTGQKLNLMNGK